MEKFGVAPDDMEEQDRKNSFEVSIFPGSLCDSTLLFNVGRIKRPATRLACVRAQRKNGRKVKDVCFVSAAVPTDKQNKTVTGRLGLFRSLHAATSFFCFVRLSFKPSCVSIWNFYCSPSFRFTSLQPFCLLPRRGASNGQSNQ
ncbi:hypothetical protein H6P81_017106 [Aristolochia fimbriata]|uniref:Uncharacterized protein n=1 Tax=Aristolochia fimbriata TaxID=158543 RepID=A0AAV7E1J3_ARIFI|nr:hypothetical protein H6P81_017106 [Aristolochia fimbriata]